MDIEKKHAMLDKYVLVKTLGAGYHAKVKLGIDSQTNKEVALKIFKNTHTLAQNLKTLQHEIGIMKQLNHPNLVNLIDVKESVDYVKKNGQTYKVMAIILEYAGGGELFEYVSNTGMFREEVARTYYHQIINALEYLHKAGFAHRDMKPENVLYDSNFNLKLADFGFSTLLAGKDGSGLLHTILGTESYMAPEIHAKQPYQGTAVDLFASAIILFILYAGTPPFTKADPKDPYYRLLCNNKHETFWNAHSKHKPKKDFFSQEFKNFINSSFALDPAQRLNIAEIKKHPWFNGPTVSYEQLRQEFSLRKQKVDAELEKARLQKLMEKEKQKNKGNFVYTGVQGFRSQTEVQNEFAGLDKKYKNLTLQRTTKTYENKYGKPNDFFTAVDAEYLLKFLLNNEQKYSKKIELNDKHYKLKCEQIGENNSKVDFQIQLLKADNDLLVVEFQKLEGDYMEFQKVTQEIKKLIEAI